VTAMVLESFLLETRPYGIYSRISMYGKGNSHTQHVRYLT
jgi:hypothetical protein